MCVCVAYSALNNHVNISVLLYTALTFWGLEEVKQNFFCILIEFLSLNNRIFHLLLWMTFLYMLMFWLVCRGAKFISKVFWNCWCSTKLFVWPCFAFLEEHLYWFFSPCRGCVHSLSLSVWYKDCSRQRKPSPCFLPSMSWSFRF